MLLYKPVHHVVYEFPDGTTNASFPDLDDAFDAADRHNHENRLQAGDAGFARVHTEYPRDDIDGRHYRWLVDLTDEGDLHVTDEPQRHPHDAITRGDHPAVIGDDEGPTFKPWYGNAAGTVVYKWQVGVIANTRRAAYQGAVRALGARQAILKATAAAAEEPDESAPEDAVLDRFIARRLGDEDETTEADRIRDGHDFPRTPRGYPYEGPHNIPGASNAALPAVDGRTLAHHLDEDMNALEGRVDLMERQFAGLAAKLGLVKVNDDPIVYRRLGPGGFQAPATPAADDFQDVTPLIDTSGAAWCNPDSLAYEIADPAHLRLARELVGLIHHAHTSGDETHLEAFTAAFAGDPRFRFHPTAVAALTEVVGALVPVLITAMNSVAEPHDAGDRDE